MKKVNWFWLFFVGGVLLAAWGPAPASAADESGDERRVDPAGASGAVYLEKEYHAGLFVALVERGTAVEVRGPARWAQYTHSRFTEAFADAGWQLHEPLQVLEVVVLADADRMHRYARQEDGLPRMPWVGYYSVGTNRIALREVRGSAESAGRAWAMMTTPSTATDIMNTDQPGAALADEIDTDADDAPAIDNRYAFVTHEAAHQLAFNLGLQRRGVMYPLWLSEGLACSFEWQGPAAGFGPAQDNPQRREALVAAVRSGHIAPLTELISRVRVPQDRPGATAAFYAQAWGLFTHLYQTRPEAMQHYFHSLRRSDLPVLTDDEAIALFEASFGEVAQVEAVWEAHLASLRAPARRVVHPTLALAPEAQE